MSDTIVARATPAGIGALAIVRLSGPAVLNVLSQLNRKNEFEMDSHTVRFARLYDTLGLIDETVVSYFKGPRSFTGDDILEISTHGSDYIVSRLINACVLFGCRLAEPGEFTQRAFLNGKIDLAQAEAVADLIAAEHRYAHDMALNQLRGGFSGDISLLRERLLNFTALIELELDFGEEDVEFASRSELRNLVTSIKQRVDEMCDSFALGNALKKGFTLVLAGRPNAGKSTLFNSLLNEDKAIVSDLAGTTRDAIEDNLNLSDFVVRLVDTAGIREATDAIEREGINRTFKHIEASGATLYILDSSEFNSEEVFDDLQKLQAKTNRVWVVANKMDLNVLDLDLLSTNIQAKTGYLPLFVSAKDKTQLNELKTEISNRFKQDLSDLTDQTVVTNVRHANALNACSAELESLLIGIDSGLTGDLLSFHLRSAISYLAAITGKIDNEEVLGTIFSKFCIGK
jgi:tRNA modification GTPase